LESESIGEPSKNAITPEKATKTACSLLRPAEFVVEQIEPYIVSDFPVHPRLYPMRVIGVECREEFKREPLLKKGLLKKQSKDVNGRVDFGPVGICQTR
jgi:hypothetical protein